MFSSLGWIQSSAVWHFAKDTTCMGGVWYCWVLLTLNKVKTSTSVLSIEKQYQQLTYLSSDLAKLQLAWQVAYGRHWVYGDKHISRRKSVGFSRMLKNSPCSLLNLYTLWSVCIFSIHFLRCWQWELVYQSRASLVGDHFLYSLDLKVLLRGNIVRGNKNPLKLTAEEKLHMYRPDCRGYQTWNITHFSMCILRFYSLVMILYFPLILNTIICFHKRCP